jgi:hypothetical protein
VVVRTFADVVDVGGQTGVTIQSTTHDVTVTAASQLSLVSTSAIVDVTGSYGVEIESTNWDVSVVSASRMTLSATGGAAALNAWQGSSEVTGQTGVSLQAETGSIDIGTKAVNVDSVCDTSGACQGSINVGTIGSRALTIGNAQSNTALHLLAGSGNMATTVTSGTYSVDATGSIAIESSAQILIGDDEVDQAIKVGTNGVRAITIGNAAATTTVAGTTIDMTFGSNEFAVQDAVQYEMIEISGAATSDTDSIGIRAREFVIFDGTTTAADMPAASDGSAVLKITDAAGTVLSDSAVSITGSSSMALAATGGNMQQTASGSFTLDAAGGVAIESASGDLVIGNDANAGAVKVGTNGARALTVGNVAEYTSLNLNAGTGHMTVGVTGGLFSLDADTGVSVETKTSGAITIGTDGGTCSSPTTATTDTACTGTWTPTTGPVSLGTAGRRSIAVGNTETSSGLVLQAGSGNMVSTVTGSYSVSAGGAVAIESSGSTIALGSTAVNQAINIGTAGQRTLTVGNTETSSGLVLQAGSGNMQQIVTGGDYKLDGDRGISLETKTSGGITIGDDVGTCSDTSLTSEGACVGASPAGTWTPTTGPVRIGTGGRRTISVGNNELNTAVLVKAGTGGIDLSAVGTSSTASNVVISRGNLGIAQSAPVFALHIGSSGDGSGSVGNSW